MVTNKFPVRAEDASPSSNIQSTPISMVQQVHARWPEMMSISTLSEYLDMSASSVRSLVAEGVLPPPSAAPRPKLKRWKRSIVDDALNKMSERRTAVGNTMDDALRSFTANHQRGH